MGWHGAYKPRRYEVGEQLLALRTRARLTQVELAALIGVSQRSVQGWEAGAAYPQESNLQRLIGVFLAKGAFSPGQEHAEASGLWQQVDQDAPRRIARFDGVWFARTLAQASQEATVPLNADNPGKVSTRDGTDPASARTGIPRTIVDLGEVIAVPNLVGREHEFATLQRWVIADRCRVVAVVGFGGIGKSSLTLIFAQSALAEFDVVLFRSLQHGPPLTSILDHAIITVSDQKAIPTGQISDKIALLVRLLRERRCLLILDNFESIMQPGELIGAYRTGYADYGMLVEALSEREHQSCLILTSREEPAELGPWESPMAPVRTLHLPGLADAACHLILAQNKIGASEQEVHTLLRLFDGNPLALNLVSGQIRDLFGGDVATFLSTGYAYLNGVQKLMEQHFARLTPLEQTIVYWFAFQRELMPLDILVEKLGAAAPPREILEALESLIRRGQVERGADSPTFTLQPMILDFVTAQLIDKLCQEILTAKPHLLERHAVIQATAEDHVRRHQEQFVAVQLLERLVAMCRGADAVEQHFIALLGLWRDQPHHEYGYGPSNILNLLRLLRGDLRSLEL